MKCFYHSAHGTYQFAIDFKQQQTAQDTSISTSGLSVEDSTIYGIAGTVAPRQE